MTNAEYMAVIAAAVHNLLKPHGYRKKGIIFARSFETAIALIGLQSSQASTANSLRATVNIAVWLPRLAPIRRGIPDRPTIWASHYRVRLGHLMPEQDDKWWTCASYDAAHQAAGEIRSAIATFALPALDEVSSESSVLAFWKAGHHGGLTEHERARNLSRLEAFLGGTL